MSSMAHFHTAFPSVTNFLPVLVWNGFSQEHHSMVSTQSNERMIEYWRGNGFENVILVNAKDYDDTNQSGDYVDSTAFSLNSGLPSLKRFSMRRTKQRSLPSAGTSP
jgi:phosphoketolase